jgi:hypothetical protein
LTQEADTEAEVAGGVAGDVVDDELEHATRTRKRIAAAAAQRRIARFCLPDALGGKPAQGGWPRCSDGHRLGGRLNAPAASADTVWEMPNLYLIQKSDNTGDEVSADFYERQGDDWVFLLGGSEVARLEIESIVSIAKAPRDFSS